MKVEELAKELCYRFYFGWMNGYNDLAKSLGLESIPVDAVKNKANASVNEFMDEARDILEKMKS